MVVAAAAPDLQPHMYTLSRKYLPAILANPSLHCIGSDGVTRLSANQSPWPGTCGALMSLGLGQVLHLLELGWSLAQS